MAKKPDSAKKPGSTKQPDPNVRIFAVETRFQTMARREGGVPRDQALQQAQAEIEEVKPSFDGWFDEQIQELTGLIKSVQSSRAEADWIETANFRSRQLRDSSTTLGFELLAFIANSLCELLDSVEGGSECNMESIMCHVDALVLARQMPYRRLKPDQVPELTKGLRRIVKHVAI
jgi:hypothetical protein